MKKKSSVLKIAASVLSLCFYLFMATGSDYPNPSIILKIQFFIL